MISEIERYSTAFKNATLLGDISVIPKLTQKLYDSLTNKPILWILSSEEEANQYAESIERLYGILSKVCDGNCEECKFDHCSYFDERKNSFMEV